MHNTSDERERILEQNKSVVVNTHLDDKLKNAKIIASRDIGSNLNGSLHFTLYKTASGNYEEVCVRILGRGKYEGGVYTEPVEIIKPKNYISAITAFYGLDNNLIIGYD